MSPTIKVQLVDSRNDDPVTDCQIPNTSTLGAFLDLYNIDVEEMTFKVKTSDGNVVEMEEDEALKDGMRVIVTPDNIKGS